VTLSADGSVLSSSSTATEPEVLKTATGPDPSALRTLEISPGICTVVPDAPQPQFAPAPEKPDFWTFGDSEAAHPLRTNAEVFHDKVFLATQGVWLGSIVFDVEIAHQGLAHHNCVEGNDDGPHPSRFGLYEGHIPKYAVGTALKWVMMKYVSKSMIFVFPTYGSIKHFEGGSAWLHNCW